MVIDQSQAFKPQDQATQEQDVRLCDMESQAAIIAANIEINFNSKLLPNNNTKSTDAQGILKPKSVIPREEGRLGFLIITRYYRLRF